MSTSVITTEFDLAKEISNFDIIPYNGRVYVVQEDIERVGGIYIPDSAKKDGEMQTNIGFVVGVGEGVDFCKVGDKLLYGKYSGAWLFNKKYRVMNEEDVLGKFKDASSNGKGA